MNHRNRTRSAGLKLGGIATILLAGLALGLGLQVSFRLDYPAVVRAFPRIAAATAGLVAGLAIGGISAAVAAVVRAAGRRIPVVGPAIAGEAARLAAALDVIIPAAATKAEFERKVHAELTAKVTSRQVRPALAEAFRSLVSSEGSGRHVEGVEQAWRRVFTLPELETLAVHVPGVAARFATLTNRLASEALELDRYLMQSAESRATPAPAAAVHPSFISPPAAAHSR